MTTESKAVTEGKGIQYPLQDAPQAAPAQGLAAPAPVPPAAPEPTALEEALTVARQALTALGPRMTAEKSPARFFRLLQGLNVLVARITSLEKAIGKAVALAKLERQEAAAEAKRVAREEEQARWCEEQRIAKVRVRKRWQPMGPCVKYRRHFFNTRTNVCPGCGTKRVLRPASPPAQDSETESGKP